MYYEVNVSLNGQHYFATAKRSITTAKQLQTLLKDFVKRFPKSEGFTIMSTKHPNTAFIMDINEIINE